MASTGFFRYLLRFAFIKAAIRFLLSAFSGLSVLSGRVRQWSAPIAERWHALSRFRRHFLSNCLVGFLIALVLSLFHGTVWIKEVENLAMDAMINVNQALPHMAGQEQYTFIDIDEETYQEWHEPYHIPRDKLLELIRFASRSSARLIAVDIDISREGSEPAHDEALARFIQTYNDPNRPPLLLIRSFFPSEEGERRKMRPVYLDARSAGTDVYWVQPLFKKSVADHTVRDWSLLTAGWERDKRHILPSFQLMGCAILAGAQDTLRDGLRCISRHGAGNAKCVGVLPCLKEPARLLSGHVHGPGERIIYTLDWKPRKKSPDFETIPARAILHAVKKCERDEEQSKTESGRFRCDYGLLKDRIVVIGASYQESRDLHETPLGEMPGALIIVNAIKSFRRFGQVETPVWLRVVSEVLLILLMAWAFARFNSFLATLFIGTAILVALVPISYHVFRYGVWVDFALPIIAMQLHQMFAQYEEERALLKKGQVLADQNRALSDENRLLSAKIEKLSETNRVLQNRSKQLAMKHRSLEEKAQTLKDNRRDSDDSNPESQS